MLPPTDAAFVALTAALVILVAVSVSVTTAVVMVGWLGVTVALAAAGWLQRDSTVSPLFPALLVVPVGAALAFVRSSRGAAMLRSTPDAALIGVQAFRVVVEVILWALAAQHRLPSLLTWNGRNVDVLIGITALPVAWLVAARRAGAAWVTIVWNLAGLETLLNVVVHAQLSAPTAFRVFSTQPSSAILTTVPYVWLPSALVPLAVALHAASLQRTLGRDRERR